MCVNAQLIEDWRTISNDSAWFANHFGSVQEYNFQHSNAHSNNKNFKAHFIDTRPFWILELGNYLVQEGFCGQRVEYDFDFDKNVMIVDFIGCGMTSLETRKNISAMVYFGADNFRTDKIVLKGNAEVLSRLFIFYWEDSRLRLDKLKKGSAVYQDYGDDRITFTWPGKEAAVTITKNPNITVFRNNFPMHGMILKD